jgi:hypothetical protein
MLAFLDPVNTIATKRIVPGVVDLVFKSGPLMAFIKRNALQRYEGGPSWQENFMYGIQDVYAYSPGDTFALNQRQVATGTTVVPRYYVVPVTAFIEKLKIEMNGPQAVFDYVDLLLQNAAMSMSAYLACDAYRHGQNVSGVDRSLRINALEEALNDGTNAGPFGYAFPNYLTLSRITDPSRDAIQARMTQPNANINGPITYSTLEHAWNSVVIGQETPDLMVTTNKGMSYIKMAFQGQQRFEGTSQDFGFQGIKFNGSVILQDQYAPGTETPSTEETNKLGIVPLDGSADGHGNTLSNGETLWFLNTKYLRFYVSTDPLFGFGFTGFLPAQNNSVVAGRYHFAGNMTNVGPRYSRVLFGIRP